MKPRITVITIGVDDLERSLHFCRDGLGLATQRGFAARLKRDVGQSNVRSA